MVRIGDIAHMQDDIGINDFFERGAERGDEIVRQVGNETHGVADHDFAAMRQFDLAHGGVERGEEQVFRKHPCPGQPVEQR
ncbi:hypothetical protein D3C87_2014550 [compost metagenome]